MLLIPCLFLFRLKCNLDRPMNELLTLLKHILIGNKPITNIYTISFCKFYMREVAYKNVELLNFT